MQDSNLTCLIVFNKLLESTRETVVVAVKSCDTSIKYIVVHILDHT